MLDFAETIFGETFTPDAFVGEKTLTYAEWTDEIAQTFGEHAAPPPPTLASCAASWTRLPALSACPECLLPYTNFQHIEVTSRAVAEHALRAILSNQDHPVPDLDPLTGQWEPQTEAPQLDSASNLEVRFRQMVRDALEARNATVKDIPNAGGVEWHITFASGEEWSMREQVDYGYTRPDFLFQHRRNRSLRPVAVYTDGAAYHCCDRLFGSGVVTLG